MIHAAVLIASLVLGQENEVQTIPHLKDETPLVEIKAHPEKYVGKTFVICGGVKIDDYYNYGYEGAKDTHYSLDFGEAGNETGPTAPERAHLYLRKTIGDSIVDAITKFESEHGKRAGQFGTPNCKLARVKATLLPAAYAQDKQWDMFEVIDAQFVQKDLKGWQPWVIEGERDRQQALKEQKAEAARKAAKERAEAAKRRSAADEAAKWRTWTDSAGTKIDAKYSGMISRSVKLVKRDGSAIKIPLDDLSAEDQDWIKNRKR